MMSRKNYRALAEILATSRTVPEVTARLSRYLAEDNPRFDRNRFLIAATADDLSR